MAKSTIGCPLSCLWIVSSKVRQDSTIINKAVYLALGVNTDGQKDLLGMWMSENEGSKFWLSVLTELKNRGLKDILIACVDGLKGFPDAINTIYPDTHIQLCIIHMVRNNLKYVSWKDYKAVTADLKKIYQAVTEDAALQALDEFGQKWDEVSSNQQVMACQLVESKHVFRLFYGYSQSDLHDECD